MVRTDKSARGGAAARLLAAEKELSRITADATETRSMPCFSLVFLERGLQQLSPPALGVTMCLFLVVLRAHSSFKPLGDSGPCLMPFIAGSIYAFLDEKPPVA